MNRLLIPAVCATTLLILTACAAPITAAPTVLSSNTPPPTGTSTAAPTAITTPTPTITPSPTITPTATDILPTPDFLTLPIAEDFLFAPGSDPDCQLPCWQGLRVGESDRDDIQKLFDEGFGFGGAVDFFAPSPPVRILSIYNLDLPNTQATGYKWQFPSEDRIVDGSFTIFILVDNETGTLQGIQFHYLPIGDFPVPEPRQIIQNLGTPSYMYIEIDVVPEEGIRSDTVAFDTRILYSAGMAFEFYFQADTQERVVNGANRKFTDYCLDTKIAAGTNYIVAPFDDLWGAELSPTQEAWLLGLVDPARYEPVEEVFALALEEIVAIAHDENPCIELDVTHLYE